MSAMIHRHLWLIANCPWNEYPKACFSIPEERHWLLVEHPLKPCGLVEGNKIDDEVDKKVIERNDVERYMIDEVEGETELWDIYTREWNDEAR
jgi:hypothetical protein